MNKLVVLALLGFLQTGCAVAQGDSYQYERDRRYCASGQAGVDYRTCMWQIQNDRERQSRDRGYRDRDRDDRRVYDYREQQMPPPPPPPRYGRQYDNPPERPKLSDMQQRALDNCAMLQPRDQPRCRATVMSTVR